MSYDLIVYAQSERLPEPALLATELSGRAPWLAFPASLDLRVASGYVPLGITGFEVWLTPITTSDIENHKEALRDAGEPDDELLHIFQSTNMSLMFSCKDDREIAAATMVAGALATLTEGYVSDPQRGTTVHAGYLPAG